MPGPFFYVRCRVQAAAALQDRGVSAADAVRLVATLDAPAIDAGVRQVKGATKAIGDGKILARIVAFFRSDLGKALIELLVSLLLVAGDGEGTEPTAAAE